MKRQEPPRGESPPEKKEDHAHGEDHIYATGEVAKVGQYLLFRTTGDNPLKPGTTVKVLREGVLLHLTSGGPQTSDGIVAFASASALGPDGFVQISHISTVHVTISECMLSGLEAE